jgi:hypothetical protein
MTNKLLFNYFNLSFIVSFKKVHALMMYPFDQSRTTLDTPKMNIGPRIR